MNRFFGRAAALCPPVLVFSAWASLLSLALNSNAADVKPADTKTAEAKADEFFAQAKAAYSSGKRDEALRLLGKAIEADPGKPQFHFAVGQIHDAARAHENAIAAYSEVIKLDPKIADAWQKRGEAHFKLGHIVESIADWDKVIELVPKQAPHHWQRGISCYYAGRFADGRRQFELHQTVNKNDVENAVWHFLCVARESGLEKARAALIPIKNDGRIPMMAVHALFAGKLKPEEIPVIAKAGQPDAGELGHRLFYANLYLGLYYEATGDAKLARDYIFKAAEKADENSYMGDVARVHAEILRKKDAK
jgi:lipoprotein NlpI